MRVATMEMDVIEANHTEGATVSLVPIDVAGQTPAAPKTQASKKSTALPRTPWGDPDLEGLWSNTTRGMPGAMLPGFYNHNYHILQTPGFVAIVVVEMIHDARIVPVDGRPHLDKDLRQWLGDSRGRW
jgi:hypothetical protein